MKKTVLILLTLMCFGKSFSQLIKENAYTRIEYFSLVGNVYSATVTNKQTCKVKILLTDCVLDTICLSAGDSEVVQLDPGNSIMGAKALENCTAEGKDVPIVLICFTTLATPHLSNIQYTRVIDGSIKIDFDVEAMDKGTSVITQYSLDGKNWKNALVFIPANNSHVTKTFTIHENN